MNRDNTHTVLFDLERLHAVKQRAYGSSWRKNGEQGSIAPNVARKVDRLEVLLKDDDNLPGEGLLDTVTDLAVYALLYTSWLSGYHTQPDEGVHVMCAGVSERVLELVATGSLADRTACIALWRSQYAALEEALQRERVGTLFLEGGSKALYTIDIAAAAVAYTVYYRDENPITYERWSRQWQPKLPTLNSQRSGKPHKTNGHQLTEDTKRLMLTQDPLSIAQSHLGALLTLIQARKESAPWQLADAYSLLTMLVLEAPNA